MYNEAAKLNGFVDASMMKVDPYESKTFIQEMENTWQVGKDDKRQTSNESHYSRKLLAQTCYCFNKMKQIPKIVGVAITWYITLTRILSDECNRPWEVV